MLLFTIKYKKTVNLKFFDTHLHILTNFAKIVCHNIIILRKGAYNMKKNDDNFKSELIKKLCSLSESEKRYIIERLELHLGERECNEAPTEGA